MWRAGADDPGRAVIFDVDGVICNADGRQHLLDGPEGDWSAFFDACGSDTLVEETGRLMRVLDPTLTVVLLTGRPVRVRDITVEWLAAHALPWDLLVMRERGDYADSLEFKRQTVRRLRAMGFQLELAWEDDPLNQGMFQEEGVPCIYLDSGYYRRRDGSPVG